MSRALYRALDKAFAEGPSAKKRSRQAPAPLAVSLPRADPRQRNSLFFEFLLPRAGPRQRTFFLKSLPRASSLALGKEIFRIFSKKTFAEGYCKGPRQRNSFFLNFFLKKPLPRACSLALGKEIFRIFLKKNFAEGYC